MCPFGFCHAVRVLLSAESCIPENLHHNLTVSPSWTLYSGFTVPRSTGGSDGMNDDGNSIESI